MKKYKRHMHKMMNRYFRTKANNHVLKKDWKYKMYTKLVNITNERKVYTTE